MLQNHNLAALRPRRVKCAPSSEGGGQKYTFDGIAAEGSRIHYGFTTHFDGKAVPIFGAGVPGGGDTVKITRLDPNTGRSIVTLRVVVSKDGTVTTQTRRGTLQRPNHHAGTYLVKAVASQFQIHRPGDSAERETEK